MSDREPVARPARGALLALAAAALAAAFLIALRIANQSAPREATVLGLLAWAAVFNGGLTLARFRGPVRRPSRVTITAALVLALFTIFGNLGVAGALAHLDPGITSTIQQTQVFVVGLGGWLLLGERVTPRLALGMLFAFGGFVVLGAEDPTRARIDLAGVALAMLSAFSFGAMLLYTRKVITRIDPVAVNTARLVLAVLVLGAYTVPTGALGEMTTEAWIATAAAAFAGPFVSRLCLMHAVVHLSASRVQLVALLTPVFAFALEALFFRTFPSTREMLGGLLILAGVGFSNAARVAGAPRPERTPR